MINYRLTVGNMVEIFDRDQYQCLPLRVLGMAEQKAAHRAHEKLELLRGRRGRSL